MANFDVFKKEKNFDVFINIAIYSENLAKNNPTKSILYCYKSLEAAIKWLYSSDSSLVMPFPDNLNSMINTSEFHLLIDDEMWKRINFIKKQAEIVENKKRKHISVDEAVLCLKNLYLFFDYIMYCYSDNYIEADFNEDLLPNNENLEEYVYCNNINYDNSLDNSTTLKKIYTQRRVKKQSTYVHKPINLTEYQTRKIYIDTMLIDVGWTEGKDWINEVELKGMPNKSGVGYADYILYDDAHTPLAIIEAKKTCVDVSVGRNQAGLYADIVEKMCGRRPVVFLTNGFETRIIDNQYPERKVSSIYSKRDLEKLFNLKSMKKSLNNIIVDKNIAGRYYQEQAIKAVADSLDKKNRRKALLVMATGSGKTRTVIALVKALLEAGWIKNILFLADRNSLVTQAKRSFTNLLKNLSCANLIEDKQNYNSHCIFSTYQTMMGCIDTIKDEKGKLFTCGHFDLIICDEAHRSIYNKYKDIFNYFDSLLIGLTATPKDEIDKNTYSIFELESGYPTYGYDLAQAVKDGYLVDYKIIDTKLKFMEEGITYEELSEEDKEEYEKTFADDDGSMPESIDSEALNNWLFNEDTIKKVIDILMKNGIKVDYGSKLGKTIIFARNHKHAEKILEIFNKEYPELASGGKEYAKVIDNYINYAQSAIDDFSDARKMPQIAISVDMLDTGVDIPEIVNLVFFKKVLSKAKFWQMIGRGTRLCQGLINGKDKEKFYIFDFCGNFEFFKMNKGEEDSNQKSLQASIFNLQFQMAFQLQKINYQTDHLIKYRKKLVDYMVGKVNELNKDNFAVHQHIQHVDKYSSEDSYSNLTFEDTCIVKEEISPLLIPYADDASALRFDVLIYGIELAKLSGKDYNRWKNDLIRKVTAISMVGNIPEIKERIPSIKRVLTEGFVTNASINELEEIRIDLREIMKYLPVDERIYNTNFSDDILSSEWKEPELDSEELKAYKERAEYYVRSHQENKAIAKLKSNKPLNEEDVLELEKILWSEVGSKNDYKREIGDKPLGEFVRSIVGLDMNAAKEAFSEYLNDTSLDSRQIYFVNQIIEYIVQNGMMKDLSVLQESPFTDRGSVVEIFDDISVWNGIRKVIDTINDNAAA